MTPEEFEILNENYKFHEGELYHSAIENKLYDLEGVSAESIAEFCSNVLDEKAIKLKETEDFKKLFAATQSRQYDDHEALRFIQMVLLTDTEVVKRAVQISREIESFKEIDL